MWFVGLVNDDEIRKNSSRLLFRASSLSKVRFSLEHGGKVKRPSSHITI
jgi:hypothetical protein